MPPANWPWNLRVLGLDGCSVISTADTVPLASVTVLNLADNEVTVELPGGPLVIEWRPGGSIRMTGPATLAYTGEIDLEAFR